MFYFLLENAQQVVLYPKDAFRIQDGNAFFHILTNLPSTFGEI